MTQPYLPGAAVGSQVIFDELVGKYEESFGHDDGLHRLVQHFLTYLPTDARVLDCGCGTGKPVCHMVAESGRAIHGIDVSKNMVELSRRQVPQGTFEQASMLEYSPSPGSFGGITATLSLFELKRAELTAMAHKWFQWLRPGGYLLICTIAAEDCPGLGPDLYEADGECASGIPWVFMGHQVYLTLFTQAGWRKMFEGAGFEIAHTEKDLFKPPAAAECDDEMHYFVIAKKPEA